MYLVAAVENHFSQNQSDQVQGEVCMGRGSCKCGRCECDKGSVKGQFCQIDAACQLVWPCIKAQMRDYFKPTVSKNIELVHLVTPVA